MDIIPVQGPILPPELWHMIHCYLPSTLCARIKLMRVCREWFEDDYVYRTFHKFYGYTTRYLTDDMIGRMINLNSLCMEGTLAMKQEITGGAFKPEHAMRLKRLHLCSLKTIGDDHISKLSSLTFLGLRFMPHISDEAIKGLTSLTTLVLGQSSPFVRSSPLITDEGILPLTKLVELAIGDNLRITAKSVNTLRSLKMLYIERQWNARDLSEFKTTATILEEKNGVYQPV